MVWGSFHLQNWLANGFLDESVPLPSGASLPPVDLPPDMVGAAPPKPDLTSLCYNAKVKTAEGLPSLRVPDKIMTAWHDHATFGSEFKQWLTECEANAIPIGCTPMGNPYIHGCLIPRIRRGHNKYHGYSVRGAPDCPLIEEVVQRLIKHLVFLRISTMGFHRHQNTTIWENMLLRCPSKSKNMKKTNLGSRLKESLHFEVHSSEKKHVRAVANNVTTVCKDEPPKTLTHFTTLFAHLCESSHLPDGIVSLVLPKPKVLDTLRTRRACSVHGLKVRKMLNFCLFVRGKNKAGNKSRGNSATI